MENPAPNARRRRVDATALNVGDVIADRLDKTNLATIEELVPHGHRSIGAWCREGDRQVYYSFGPQAKVTVVETTPS